MNRIISFVIFILLSISLTACAYEERQSIIENTGMISTKEHEAIKAKSQNKIENVDITLTEEQKEVEDAGFLVKWLNLETEQGTKAEFTGIWNGSPEGLFVFIVDIDQWDNKHYSSNKISKYGFVDKAGEIIIPAIYDYADSFKNGIARVDLNDKRFYIDTKGEIIPDVNSDGERVTPFLFKEILSNDKWGLVDEAGAEILPCEYQQIQWLDNGLIWAGKEYHSGFSLFDETGKELLTTEYDFITRADNLEPMREHEYLNKAELLFLEKGKKWGVVDKSGKIVIPIEYEFVYGWTEEICAARKNGKWGHVDFKGKSITPFVYDNAEMFSNGLAKVEMNGKWGYVDMQGSLVIPCEYDTAEYFFNGVAAVSKIIDGRLNGYIIDKAGEVIIGPKDYRVYAWGNTYTSVNNDYKYALLDKQGNRITRFYYSMIRDFKYGFAIVDSLVDPATFRYGLINQYGVEILPQIFSNIVIVDSKTCFVQISSGSGSLNSKIGILELPKDALIRKPKPSERPITVYLDGLDIYFDTEPIIINDRIMVPIRKISEMLGTEVSWDEKSRKITAVNKKMTVEMVIGNDIAFSNGTPISLEVPAMIQNDRTLVPLRFIAEIFGFDVEWNSDNRRAIITSKGYVYQ